MPFAIHYDKNRDVVFVHAKGDIDSVAAHKIALRIKRLNPPKACGGVLVDMNAANLTICPYDIRLMIDNIIAIGFERLLPTAVVTGSRLPNYAFLEWLAQNKGYKLKVCVDFRAALKWLAGNPDGCLDMGRCSSRC